MNNISVEKNIKVKKGNMKISGSLKKDIIIDDLLLKNFINLTENEKEMVRKWRNNDGIRKWCQFEHIISIEEHCKFLKKLKNDDHNFYWLVRKKSKYIGVISLNRVDFINRNSYLGLYSNPLLKGMGILLINCLKRIAFDTAYLHTLKLEVKENNEKAIKFFKKSGFETEGILIDFFHKEDKYENLIVMGLIN